MDEVQGSLKRILSEMLKDMDIQEEIRKIVRKDREQEREFQQRIAELEKEKRALHFQLEEAQIECGRLHESCRELERENTALEKEKQEIQAAKDEMGRQLLSRKEEFEPLEEISKIWQGLSKLEKSQKSYLQNLCGSWDIKSFIALGKDKSGIRQLWNFIRDEIMKSNRNSDEIQTLSEYFDLCISVYNITNIRKERYEKTEVSLGTEYDSRQYIKTSESVVNGVVKEVLLNGYYMQDDVMKPIVTVR